jgi:2-amino-4-hydroxy-6-hydroxymethyldihydropteridine diphosphokinase
MASTYSNPGVEILRGLFFSPTFIAADPQTCLSANSPTRAKRDQLANPANPANSATLDSMPLTYIALGSNLPSPAGPPDATLAAALPHLATLGGITARSSLYSTAPVGIPDQPRFLNAVVALDTALSPFDLLDALLSIELNFGRDRSASVPNGPRTLDLDILLYGDLVLSTAGLEIPHARLAQRAFVLIPLAEIAPTLRDPRSGLTVTQLLANLAPNDSAAEPAVARVQSPLWPSA